MEQTRIKGEKVYIILKYLELFYILSVALDAIERSYSTVVVLCTYGEHFPALCKGPEFEPRWDQPVLLVLTWNIYQYLLRWVVDFGDSVRILCNLSSSASYAYPVHSEHMQDGATK